MSDNAETAVLAGGCYWIMQQLLRGCEGVISTHAGWTGGENASGHWPGEVVTEVNPAGGFWEAEAEDQDYFQRYPAGCAPPFPRRDVAPAR